MKVISPRSNTIYRPRTSTCVVTSPVMRFFLFSPQLLYNTLPLPLEKALNKSAAKKRAFWRDMLPLLSCYFQMITLTLFLGDLLDSWMYFGCMHVEKKTYLQSVVAQSIVATPRPRLGHSWYLRRMASVNCWGKRVLRPAQDFVRYQALTNHSTRPTCLYDAWPSAKGASWNNTLLRSRDSF